MLKMPYRLLGLAIPVMGDLYMNPYVSRIVFDDVHFKIHDIIDTGSSSQIFSAVKDKDVSERGHHYPQHVAVKTVCPEKEDYLKYVDREVIALSKLHVIDSAHIVRLFVVSGLFKAYEGIRSCRALILSRTGKDFDRFCSSSNDFNSPVLDGVERRTRGKVSVEVFAASAGLILIDTLEKIHREGITHGDIHDYNIALSWPNADQPVFLDFGGSSISDTTSEEEFEANMRRDASDIRALIIAIVSQRIRKEFGKEKNEELLNMSALVRLIKPASGLTTLTKILKEFLYDSIKLDWDSYEPKQIVYHKN